MEARNDWNATLYDTRAAFVSGAARDLVEMLRARPGESVLDLGCGTGTLAAEIARSGARVAGVDSSAEMLEQARAKYPDIGFRQGDGQRLDDVAAYDAVFSNAALHWMTRAEDTASGIARALVPGGRFVAEFGGAGCVARVRDAALAALDRLGESAAGMPAWYFPKLGEYTSLLEGVGLAPSFAVLFPRPTPVAGVDGLAGWLRLFCAPVFERLGARSESFVDDVERACRPALFRGDHWELDYVRLRVVAGKSR